MSELKDYFDRNPDSIPYLDRLVREWTMHDKIIIAVDFDDTVSPWKMEDFDPDKVINVLKLAKETGAYIVVFTACNPKRHKEIYKYLADKGIDIDGINKNPIDLPYGNDGKIYANIFIDDRAGLNESLKILEFAAYQIRSNKFKSNFNDTLA